MVMTSKERMRCAMQGRTPDRVPVMCQLSLGHLYRLSGLDPVRFWYTSEGLAEAFELAAERYRFDGILVVKQGRDPALPSRVRSVEPSGAGHVISWNDGRRTFVPPDDYPYALDVDRGPKPLKTIDGIDWRTSGLPVDANDLDPFFFDVLDPILRRKGAELSIHGEVGTVFERFLGCFGSFEGGLMALLDEPDRCLEVLDRMTEGVVVLALAQARRGIDALKLSSPLAGAGFISRAQYAEFVLPFERRIVDAVRRETGVPCYMHTCGSIGDRLDLVADTGVAGIECLDPPPLGDVDLEEAVRAIGDRVFIKGNLDSVNELAGTTPDEVRAIARKRLAIGMRNPRGYILSTACSVSPNVPPENVAVLAEAAEAYGRY